MSCIERGCDTSKKKKDKKKRPKLEAGPIYIRGEFGRLEQALGISVTRVPNNADVIVVYRKKGKKRWKALDSEDTLNKGRYIAKAECVIPHSEPVFSKPMEFHLPRKMAVRIVLNVGKEE